MKINIKHYRRLLILLLLPFVIAGSIYIYKEKRINNVSAVDLIQVTYNGNAPPVPVFYVTNMLPGDEVEKTFKVINVYSNSLDVTMKSVFVDEEKDFADILEIIMGEVGGPDIYGGTTGFKTVQNFLDESSPFVLGNIPAGSDKSYRVKVKFPSPSGNEYQLALVIFDIIWSAQIPIEQLPPECAHLCPTSVIEGTEDSERLTGTNESDLIIGHGGNDRIKGLSGDDCIIGGEGNDHLEGGPGDDSILGGSGNDKIQGASGKDLIYGGSGNDNIDGGSNDDVIYGEGGNDDLRGYTGEDLIYGGGGNDTIRGEAGRDKLYGEADNDTITGGNSDDFLDGGSESDYLNGNSGSDECINGETIHFCEL
ncbi:hypothetical protein A3A76_01760 [Candidatus Woesebacteria bacterium RIFCSPLOWO2_01_FULL_39_23]|uniref:Uncharacterized protein n=1 Tax=Candidatus Woesebacteria bacterium RIFCSPHIGHO2_01_FULL_40_22 TaxID=1802499 RepID=A0A1F7YEQ0_9BACT|nr:MAG: hypothetical protein A2141_02335 [Candidatus Woesebacteria bacterium RBG_16_40_11]OGM25806.1 MAG: hypothetical protein A2628_00615 [Candidatus Woesebacteria bacterium RIFCSPHIGHO2_01_FULL_40_22]OGM36373.1 MAG: hypothetical protein A3E41_04760 [Candidatus Woesebacteria bacterium RIFCSPHIGHO2_12_FULL_38_9]OGM61759.1 MAG: hypothetical protein A3A76_01760 [Candidatus Woesebacteria bacterium RIFCSPLOWO2_01_FULL_39_23]